ncbi:spore gernimation protein GerM [Caloranaerobacter sp. TR13]|uniref:GerMN domain-containing protein n=1 Tax=Caloranaerobacter sp. TR13 TaxID=1302151 RepID=UPI0006D423F1|nr:GerMN domain-containing protein [Caloranaerobacter sp. TR13]KPU26999.1 spore gernimation protein GerM [Caloranaerobacter sp. TR13]
MSIKKVVVIILILALSVSIYGCKAIDTMKNLFTDEEETDVDIVRSDEDNLEVSSEVELRDTVLYFQDQSGYLIPVKRQIPWEEGIAKAALRNMIDSVALREDIGVIGLEPIIPTGTQIRGMSIDKETGLCKVDFSKEIMNYNSKTEEQNLVKGIVYTLTEFPTINKVQFMIEGKIVDSLKFGTKIGKPLVRKDINLIDTASKGESRVVVYFKNTANGEYEYYVPVTVPTSAPQANILTALQKLFEGPPVDTALYSDIPDGVKLQGVEIKEGIAYVDIYDENDAQVKDQAVFDKMAKNIGLTLSEFEDIIGVEILLDGKTLEEAGIEVEQPETLPVFANEY